MNNTKSHISQLKLLSSRKFSTNLRNLKINRTDLLFILLCLAIGIYLLATKPIFVTILGCATIVFLSIGYVIRTVPILEKYLGRKIRFWHIVATIITVTALLDTFTTPAQAIFLSGLESFFNNLALDKQGVEFLTSRGGKPIYVDLFHQQIGRALITGTSGSGKSVLGWRFALEALANNIPVVGMDISGAIR